MDRGSDRALADGDHSVFASKTQTRAPGDLDGLVPQGDDLSEGTQDRDRQTELGCGSHSPHSLGSEYLLCGDQQCGTR